MSKNPRSDALSIKVTKLSVPEDFKTIWNTSALLFALHLREV